MEKVSLADAFDSFDEPWSPRLAAELNGQAVKLARLEDEFVWHHHDDADELFFVVDGDLRIEFREGDAERDGDEESDPEGAAEADDTDGANGADGADGADGDDRVDEKGEENDADAVTLEAGEFVVVPRGVEHRPVALPTAKVLLFEPVATRNTGNVDNERTVDAERL